MIEAVLPDCVASVEAYADEPNEPVFPGEEHLVAHAVTKRRQEFATGRRCAREALNQLGVAPRAILSGSRREPLWPAGTVGSITHCPGYRAAAVASIRELSAIGIDAEPNEPLPDGVLELIAQPLELSEVRRGFDSTPGERVCADRLLFSIKEAIFKAWYPLTRAWLDFAEVEVQLGSGIFTVRRPKLVEFAFDGRWLVRDDLLLTALTVGGRDAS